MTDFMSQEVLRSNHEPVKDYLSHDNLAGRILEKVNHLPPGAVIALQGSWGRGKTDVLTRIAKKSSGLESPNWLASDALWINPWQYGTPDLLTPLVLNLLERIPSLKEKKSETIRRAAESIIRAGINFGLKATAMTVPGGKILDTAAEPIDKLLEGLFSTNAKRKASLPDPDPVAKMGARFRELVEKILVENRDTTKKRLLVCVDDLDRCLPNRQVALLEALRFLTSADAPATFIIAIDPTLAREAVRINYATESFDPDRYLDKMFHLRLNLPAVSAIELSQLVLGHLNKSILFSGNKSFLKDIIKASIGDIKLDQIGQRYKAAITEGQSLSQKIADPLEWVVLNAAIHSLTVEDLRNPRIIERIFTRLFLLVCSDSKSLQQNFEIESLFLWLGLIERWPKLRFAIQDAGINFPDRFAQISQMFAKSEELGEPAWAKSNEEVAPAVIERLPNSESSPELSQIFSEIYRNSHLFTRKAEQDDPELYYPLNRMFDIGKQLYLIDNLLVENGL